MLDLFIRWAGIPALVRKGGKMKPERYDDLLAQLDPTRLPRHIAVIMDGNGRWATRRHLPRSAGHKAGAEALRRATELCRELHIGCLSVYAFSTENWSRPAEEVGFLMRLLVEYLHSERSLLRQQQIRLGFLGRRDGLPAEVLRALDETLAETASYQEMQLNLAVNYGGRDELRRAVQALVAEAAAGRLTAAEVDEAKISAQLDTAGLPDPDLLIRPSGELRISNYLLWQGAYSELYFCDKLWPDFGKRDLLAAILEYQKRDRRFGAVKR